MNSMDSSCMARMNWLPSFQQVIHEGESVQIMWMGEAPSAGYL